MESKSTADRGHRFSPLRLSCREKKRGGGFVEGAVGLTGHFPACFTSDGTMVTKRYNALLGVMRGVIKSVWKMWLALQKPTEFQNLPVLSPPLTSLGLNMFPS